MTRKLSAVILGVFMLAVWNASAYAEYWEEGNDGDSWETAYVIDSVEDFLQMRYRSSSEQGKYYKLTADLDLTTESDLSYYFFNGHFDGQNHKITIAITQIDSSCGLFAGVSSDAVAIRNLNVDGSVSGGNVVGGIASHLEAGIIENCSFTGTVESVHMEDDNLVVDAGGIVGDLNNKGIIRNCTFQGTVRASGINDGTAGGIIASTNGGTIENCTVSSGSTIEASRRAGGIAGEVGQHMGDYETQSTYITNCTSYAQLAGNATSKGGIVGEILNDTINYFEGNTWPSEYPQSGSGSTNPDYNPTIPGNESADIPQTVSADLPEGIVQPVILSSDVVENIARTLSIDSSQIQFISQENIAPAEDPSQSMIDYVQADNHEITGKLGVISVDTAGVYVVKVVMTDELYAVLKDQNVANFRIYALSDKDPADVNTSLISGMIGTWEILSLSGEKLTNFGVREFLMVGMLNAGTPFSMYIAKILIALLLGGCNSSINTIWLGVLALIVFAALRFRKR